MLNLTFSDKPSETVLPASAIITDLTFCAFVGAHLHTCIVLHGFISLDNTSEPTTKAAGSEVLFK